MGLNYKHGQTDPNKNTGRNKLNYKRKLDSRSRSKNIYYLERVKSILYEMNIDKRDRYTKRPENGPVYGPVCVVITLPSPLGPSEAF